MTGCKNCAILKHSGCYLLLLETEAKELSLQVARVLASGAKASAFNSQCPAGADSCDRDRFWKTLGW